VTPGRLRETETGRASLEGITMPSEQPALDRIHERLDDLFSQIARIEKSTAIIEQRCLPCQDAIRQHQEAIHGNGQSGLKSLVATNTSDIAALKLAAEGGGDRLSVRGMVILLGAVGALAASIGASMAAIIR
jgi:hypothetical protein